MGRSRSGHGEMPIVTAGRVTVMPVIDAPVDETQQDAAAGAESVSATRGGFQLLVAAVVSLFANYLFLLGAGRLLGTADYGTLAALTGLLTVFLLPTSALQMAVSRELSRREAVGEHDEASVFARSLLVVGLKVTLPLLAVALALVVPLRELLQLDATAPVALAVAALGGVFVYPVALGVLQGQQRFRALAFNSAAPMVVRLLLLVLLALVGMRLYGALGAIIVSGAVAITIALIAIRGTLRARPGVVGAAAAAVPALPRAGRRRPVRHRRAHELGHPRRQGPVLGRGCRRLRRRVGLRPGRVLPAARRSSPWSSRAPRRARRAVSSPRTSSAGR